MKSNQFPIQEKLKSKIGCLLYAPKDGDEYRCLMIAPFWQLAEEQKALISHGYRKDGFKKSYHYV
jgi:hypothetical protein